MADDGDVRGSFVCSNDKVVEWGVTSRNNYFRCPLKYMQIETTQIKYTQINANMSSLWQIDANRGVGLS